METIYFLLTMHDGHMLTVKKFVSSALTHGNHKLAIHCLPGLQISNGNRFFYALYVWGRASNLYCLNSAVSIARRGWVDDPSVSRFPSRDLLGSPQKLKRRPMVTKQKNAHPGFVRRI